MICNADIFISIGTYLELCSTLICTRYIKMLEEEDCASAKAIELFLLESDLTAL